MIRKLLALNESFNLNLMVLLLSLTPILLTVMYATRYSVSHPVADEWASPVDMAYDVKNGTFSLGDILEPANGIHRVVPYNVMHVLVVQFTNWDTGAMGVILILMGLLRLAIGVYLFAETLPSQLTLVLVPFSALIFAVDQGQAWLTGIYAVWHFTSIFPLLAVLVLKKAKTGWPALVGVALLCLMSTFSQGSGWFVSFPVMGVALWMFGYRKPGHFIFWIIAAGASLWAYTVGISAESEQASFSIISKIANMEHFLAWMTAFLGNPFTTTFDRTLPMLIGVLGLAAIVFNLLYLWQHEDGWKRVNVWIALAGIGLAADGATFLGQYNEEIIQASEDQIGRLVRVAAPDRYSLMATHFWIGLVALMAVAYWHHSRTRPESLRWWGRLLIVGNTVLIFLLGGLYVRETTWYLQFQTVLTGQTIADNLRSESETCFRQVVLTRDACWPDRGDFEITYQRAARLAIYGLAQYRDHEVVALLPPAYVEGSPLVMDTPSIWMNAYLRKWYVPGIDESDIFHIAPPNDTIQYLADPLTNIATDYSGNTDNLLQDFVGNSDTVWFLRTDETAVDEAHFTDILMGLDHPYLPTVVPLTDPLASQHLTLIRFDQAPQLLDDSLQFGDALNLVGWRLRSSDAESPACQELTVQTWWQASEALTANHQIRLTFTFEDGTLISEAAGGLTTVPNVFWEPGQLYLDEQRFFVACELMPGRYDLAVQINDADTSQPLAESPQILRDWLLE